MKDEDFDSCDEVETVETTEDEFFKRGKIIAKAVDQGELLEQFDLDKTENKE